MPEVSCVGILVADVIGRTIDSLPERGKLMRVEQMELHYGGCAAHTGGALARLGVETALIGKVGDDGFGDFMVRAMDKEGIDTTGIVRSQTASTSATMVMVDSGGERSFIHYLGANAEFALEDVNTALVKESRLLHVGGTFLMPAFDGQGTVSILRQAREAGAITSLDTAWDFSGRWLSVLDPCLEHLDYFVPSMDEARMVSGQHSPRDVAGFLIDHGVGTVALKMGEDGCYVRNRLDELTVPAYPVSPVDATGAGDAFAAGFLTGVVRNWDLETTARFACAVGAMSVAAIGATTGIRSLDQTLDFMRSFHV
jgi:sugar/nucleoside kinase (ribokinase family)